MGSAGGAVGHLLGLMTVARRAMTKRVGECDNEGLTAA